MNARLVYIQSSKEPWADEALALYKKKLSGFGNFEILAVKARSHGRAEAEKKKRAESELLLKKLDSMDFNVLLDECGKAFDGSLSFSNWMEKNIESHRRISFFIGGAYGFNDELKSNFQQEVSLSALTMNHHLAKVVLLEQVYRALTIIKGIPYHNS